MKITKQQLKQIIKEEITKLGEQSTRPDRATQSLRQDYDIWLAKRPNDAGRYPIDSAALFLLLSQPAHKIQIKYNPDLGNGDLADEIASSGKLTMIAKGLETNRGPLDAKELYRKLREEEKKLAVHQHQAAWQERENKESNKSRLARGATSDVSKMPGFGLGK